MDNKGLTRTLSKIMTFNYLDSSVHDELIITWIVWLIKKTFWLKFMLEILVFHQSKYFQIINFYFWITDTHSFVSSLLIKLASHHILTFYEAIFLFTYQRTGYFLSNNLYCFSNLLLNTRIYHFLATITLLILILSLIYNCYYRFSPQFQLQSNFNSIIKHN